MSENTRQMTPEELVANGYPADLFTRPGAYEEYQEAKERVRARYRAGGFNDSNQPLDFQSAVLTEYRAGREVRGFGLRAQDFNGHTPYPTESRLRAPEHQQPNPSDMPPVRVARDKAVYTRQQKGHSFLLHWLVLGVFTCFIVPVYYSFSPNHYWHI